MKNMEKGRVSAKTILRQVAEDWSKNKPVDVEGYCNMLDKRTKAGRAAEWIVRLTVSIKVLDKNPNHAIWYMSLLLGELCVFNENMRERKMLKRALKTAPGIVENRPSSSDVLVALNRRFPPNL